MFLKRIEILGFKSFADRTVIELNHGITALLGPNGCGKSNIVDAIKWVLGEQSVRNMRAEKMDDVIFSGTEGRKALSVAEVTLVIANEAGLLEIDRPEIAIKRRIFREGESEYFLNGTPVRLKEIRELFFDTGVGKSAYSVMEQGRIDQVLSNRPEERRYIFEEAAGITKYRIRGSEAERKLEKTEENMVQVEHILHEVRRNYESLRKQTEKTMEYRKLRDTIFALDRDLKLLQWRELEDSRGRKSERLDSRIGKHRELVEQIEQLKSALATELDSVNQMESRLIEYQKRLYGMDLEKENQEQQVRGIRERRGEAEETREAVRAREKNIIESLNSLEELKRVRASDLAGFRDRLKEIEVNISSFQKTVNTAEERLKGNIGETDRINSDLDGEEKHRDSLQGDLRTLTDDIVKQLDRGLAESGYDRSSRRNLEQTILTLLEETRIRSDGRARLLGDRKELADGTDVQEIFDQAVTDFMKIRDSLDQAVQLFGDYCRTGTDFIEEFLAPEGIITRKRDLDEQILLSMERTRELKTRSVELTEEKSSLSAQIAEARSGLEELRVAQARTTTQVSAAEDSMKSLDRQTDNEQTRLGEIRQQIAAEDARIRGMDDQVKEILARREEMDRQQENMRRELAGLETGISSENEKMTGRENRLRELTEQRSSLEVEREKIRLEIGYIDEEIRLLHDDFRDRNSRDLAEFADLKQSVDRLPRDLRDELASAKNDLRALGHVNLMAPEEFQEVSERFDFLNNQLEDLRKARENLTQITGEIQRETAELFLRTYKEIREHFHEMFRRLFGGGRAEIRLLDSDDPLNSGLEIYAQPPGKKLENISLLSGGERSLCGVALMFATFLVKPSPFCILDEIDAALDEANIQRFVNLLVEFGNRSQFVVITHNKKTVTGARTLLGVTMQESGVSKLISLRLDGEEQEQGVEEPVTADR